MTADQRHARADEIITMPPKTTRPTRQHSRPAEVRLPCRLAEKYPTMHDRACSPNARPRARDGVHTSCDDKADMPRHSSLRGATAVPTSRKVRNREKRHYCCTTGIELTVHKYIQICKPGAQNTIIRSGLQRMLSLTRGLACRAKRGANTLAKAFAAERIGSGPANYM